MRENRRRYFLILFQIAAIVSFLIVFAYHSLASTINVECAKGVMKHYDRNFPNEAIGNHPGRVANWELDFQKGIYKIRIASRLKFIPYIYKQLNNKWRHTGFTYDIKQQKDKNGRLFYYYDFTADHVNDPYPNRKWLVQIKPSPKDQNTTHTIRLITNPKSCKADDAAKGCSCTVKPGNMSGASKFCHLYWEHRGTTKNKISFIHIYNSDKALGHEQLKANGWSGITMLPCSNAIKRAQRMCDARCKQ